MNNKILKLIMIMFICVVGAGAAIPETVYADEVSGFWRYEVEDDNTITITGYTGAESHVTVPSTIAGKKVTSINDWDGVFEDNTKLLSITFSSNMRNIGEYTFKGCTELKSISGFEYITELAEGAFKDCSSLTAVNFGKNLTHIPASCFANCVKLKDISFTNIKSIDTSAFRNCDALTSVVLPSGFRCFGYYSSYGGWTSSSWDGGAFEDCDNIKSVSIGSGVSEISSYAFKNCKALNSVAISNGVNSIGREAFCNCNNLPSIQFPQSLRYIGERAFADGYKLSTISMQFGLLRIEGAAFRGCSALSEITIPNSVKKIGSEAFRDCTGLKKVTIPNSVNTIGDGVFYDGDGIIEKNMVIYCYQNSYTENYAKERDYSYKIITAIPAVNIVFAKSTIYCEVGNELKLNYTVTPSNHTDSIEWESSYEDVAIVNDLGEVTAKGKGTVTITATTTSGRQASVNIVVSNKPERIYFNTSSKVLEKGQNWTQKAVVEDQDGRRNDIKPAYQSSNTSIATVDQNGKVAAKQAGTVKIIAKTGSLSTYYTLQVVNPKKKTISKLSVSRSGKKLTVKTISGAKVKVVAAKSVLGKSSKTVKSNGSGTAKISFKKKIKNVSIKITVSKSGYVTKTKSVRY